MAQKGLIDQENKDENVEGSREEGGELTGGKADARKEEAGMSFKEFLRKVKM